MDSIPLKRCPKCQQEKPATTEYFYKLSKSKDGFASYCKACRKIMDTKPPKPKPPIPTSKVCTQCHEEKPATRDYFYPQPRGLCGLTATCIECRKQLRMEYAHQTKLPEQGQLKQCRICKEWKPATTEYFSQNLLNRDCLKNRCRDCDKIVYQQTYIRKRPVYEVPDGYRRCPKCKEIKPATPEYFCRSNRKKYAVKLCSYCKVCMRTYAKGKPHDRTRWHRYQARKIAAGGTHTLQDIQDQLKRQKGKCYYCHKKLTKYHIEHVIPLTREGSSNDPWNIVISCPACNWSKGNKLPHEWPEGGRLM